jgi:hypothetical protein
MSNNKTKHYESSKIASAVTAKPALLHFTGMVSNNSQTWISQNDKEGLRNPIA